MKFSFSPTHKHESINLSEDNSRAKRTTTPSWAAAIVEPRLGLNAISKISFRMNNIKNARIGICYHNQVESQKFLVLNDFGQGAYLHEEDGYICSHSIADDNRKKKSGVAYRTGEVMTVELDPSTGKLTYTNKSSGGLSFTQ